MERCLALIGTVSGAGAVVAQALPGVPEGFGSWQPVAIIGFVCVVCLAVLFWLLKTVFATLMKLAEHIGALVAVLVEQSHKLDELCRKQGELVQAMAVTNTKQADLVDEWKKRPCGGEKVK